MSRCKGEEREAGEGRKDGEREGKERRREEIRRRKEGGRRRGEGEQRVEDNQNTSVTLSPQVPSNSLPSPSRTPSNSVHVLGTLSSPTTSPPIRWRATFRPTLGMRSILGCTGRIRNIIDTGVSRKFGPIGPDFKNFNKILSLTSQHSEFHK
jgi:hypothetical protein